MAQAVAVLSSTVLSLDGTYTVQTLDGPPVVDGASAVAGLPHYVGHPATAAVLDAAGAVHTKGLFPGLQVGQAFYACSLAQPRNGGADSHTSHQAVNDPLNDLVWRLVTRVA